MTYRTRTYLAGDWDGDNDAIQQIYTWNEGDKWSFHFSDAHKNKQCYDTSMPCTIKSNLYDRMKESKTFVLVVGNNTATTRKGSCVHHDCPNKQYDFWYKKYVCTVVGKTYSTQSFIDYECQLAYDAWTRGLLKIVVLYNAATVNKTKCPEILKNVGTHESMKSYNDFTRSFKYDYQIVRKAIED